MFYSICLIVTIMSAVVSFGFSVRACLGIKEQNETALINAFYALSRSFSILLIALGLVIFPSIVYLIIVSSLMIGIQISDSLIGMKISLFKTIGPLLTALVNSVALVLALIA
ncbi:hypothetical protein ACWOFR_17835 [Carnobacterium gallinarum]|uniref:hypothetical protein n=1 Tax=Carnobacterium gallinarum TaxID=2749 RepID=UPI000556291C|nr:hypothetical protein [Carnobacterium gallinarum]